MSFMNKKIMLMLIVLLFIPIIEGICCEKSKDCVISETCQDGNCGNCSIEIYNRTGTLIVEKANMSMVNSYLYTFNATTTLEDYGTYPYVINCTPSKLCQGDCQVEVVQECEGENEEFYLYILSFIIFAILVGLGYYYTEGIFVVIAGMLASIIGIVIYIYGFPNLTSTFLKTSIALVIWGVGAYLILAPAMQFYEDWKE